MSSRSSTHWCYVCQRGIRARGRDISCPNCHEGFVQELDEMGGAMINSSSFFRPDYADQFRIMEAMSALMRQRAALAGMNHEYNIRQARRQATDHEAVESDSNVPVRNSGNRGFGIVLTGGPRGIVQRGNIGDYLVGSGLEELFEQLLLGRNDRRGPPPASQSAIDSMPAVKINHRHIRGDPHCPVCKDRFEIGSEAREMPCNHLYHHSCIVPWLVQHNSCPVCRLPLPSSRSGSGRSNLARSGNRDESASDAIGGGGDRENQERRRPLAYFWPFGSSEYGSSSYQYQGAGSSSAEVHEDPNQLGYPYWPYNY